jgi:DNA invertase Pin-like site-specific DNA recombinase
MGCMTPSNRVAIYARCSTLNGQNPEMQLDELREYCARRDFQIVAEYVDAGVSGSKDSRPQLNFLMSAAQRRKFDAVLVWKLDRFGRSLKHLVNTLAELESLGVAFTSLSDNLDLTTPSGRLMFHVIAAMAQFERSLVQERVRGLRHARSKGIRLGRPRAIVNARQIADLRHLGHAWADISRRMGLSEDTLQQALKAAGKSPLKTASQVCETEHSQTSA